MPASNASNRGFSVRVRDAKGELRESAKPLLMELLLEDRVTLPDSDCWFWRNGQERGYTKTRMAGREESVHRLSFQLFVGPIPDGYFVCHRCDQPSCWNPMHLFIGTALDNNRDMYAKGRAKSGEWAKSKTHCPQGHEYTEATVYLYQGRRYCRICHKIYSLAYSRKIGSGENTKVYRKVPGRTCDVDGCEQLVKGGDYCGMHKSRLKKHGELGPPGRLRQNRMK